MTELHINPLDIPSGPSAYAAVEIDLREFIDLDEFPIHDLGHPKRQELVTEARKGLEALGCAHICLLYTSPSPRDATLSRMPSSA